MWLTCEREYWKYFICETRLHIDKILDCRLVYILGGLILILPYVFGNNKVCAS